MAEDRENVLKEMLKEAVNSLSFAEYEEKITNLK